ncbi:MAG: four helix bundle protein [Candidatus Acidiferrales bacterium]
MNQSRIAPTMTYRAEELKKRTKQFAIRVIKLFRSLPKTEEARIIGRQLLRSATSVAANYRAVCRARSKPEFIAKLGLVVEEADESALWLEPAGGSCYRAGGPIGWFDAGIAGTSGHLRRLAAHCKDERNFTAEMILHLKAILHWRNPPILHSELVDLRAESPSNKGLLLLVNSRVRRHLCVR